MTLNPDPASGPCIRTLTPDPGPRWTACLFLNAAVHETNVKRFSFLLAAEEERSTSWSGGTRRGRGLRSSGAFLTCICKWSEKCKISGSDTQTKCCGLKMAAVNGSLCVCGGGRHVTSGIQINNQYSSYSGKHLNRFNKEV